MGISDKAELFLQRIKTEGNDLTTKPNLLKGGDVVWIFSEGTYEDISAVSSALHEIFGEEFTKATELGSGYNKSPIAELLRLNEVIRETFLRGGAEDVSSAYKALHGAFGDEFTTATELGSVYNRSPIAELLRLNEVIRETFAKGGAEDVSSAYQALHGAFGDEFTKATELGAGYNKSSIGKLLHDNQQIQDALSSPETDPCPILCGAGFDFKDVMKAGLHDDHQEHFCDLVGTMHAHSE